MAEKRSDIALQEERSLSSRTFHASRGTRSDSHRADESFEELEDDILGYFSARLLISEGAGLSRWCGV
jgi:hypothetical protein